jgi:galactitol-specific phosphotransferase system IIB component
MAERKLILCVCGAGINTSMNAKMTIMEHLRDAGMDDVEVKHAMIGDITPYRGRKNMVVVWMTQIDAKFEAPGVQGMAYLIGTKKKKRALSEEIMQKMKEICKE